MMWDDNTDILLSLKKPEGKIQIFNNVMASVPPVSSTHWTGFLLLAACQYPPVPTKKIYLSRLRQAAVRPDKVMFYVVVYVYITLGPICRPSPPAPPFLKVISSCRSRSRKLSLDSNVGGNKCGFSALCAASLIFVMLKQHYDFFFTLK